MNDILMVGSIAADTAVNLIKTQREQIKERLSERFIQDALNKLSNVNWIEKDIKAYNPEYYCKLSEYGIFGGLWDYADARNCGISVKLTDINIFQETVEICEIFDINPYVCPSESVYIISAKSGYDMINLFEKNGI